MMIVGRVTTIQSPKLMVQLRRVSSVNPNAFCPLLVGVAIAPMLQPMAMQLASICGYRDSRGQACMRGVIIINSATAAQA